MQAGKFRSDIRHWPTFKTSIGGKITKDRNDDVTGVASITVYVSLTNVRRIFTSDINLHSHSKRTAISEKTTFTNSRFDVFIGRPIIFAPVFFKVGSAENGFSYSRP